jgi:hypothetical protein
VKLRALQVDSVQITHCLQGFQGIGSYSSGQRAHSVENGLREAQHRVERHDERRAEGTRSGSMR